MNVDNLWNSKDSVLGKKCPEFNGKFPVSVLREVSIYDFPDASVKQVGSKDYFGDIYAEHDKNFKRHLSKALVRDVLTNEIFSVYENQIRVSRIGGCNLCLMSDLPKNGLPEIGKMYIEKQKNQLKYLVISIAGDKVEGFLDILTSDELTSEFLNSRKSEILKITSERGHTRLEKNLKIFVSESRG
jgi:hypothetical protein